MLTVTKTPGKITSNADPPIVSNEGPSFWKTAMILSAIYTLIIFLYNYFI